MNNEPTAGDEQARKPGHMVGDRKLLAVFTTLYHPLCPVQQRLLHACSAKSAKLCRCMLFEYASQKALAGSKDSPPGVRYPGRAIKH